MSHGGGAWTTPPTHSSIRPGVMADCVPTVSPSPPWPGTPHWPPSCLQFSACGGEGGPSLS